VDACLKLRCLATDFLYLRAFARRGKHRKHSFPSTVASIRVYKAVAWQRVDQIRYNVVRKFYVLNSSESLAFLTRECNQSSLYGLLHKNFTLVTEMRCLSTGIWRS
jgi:hypothetical protein